METTCATCDNHNAIWSRYCGHCGSRLEVECLRCFGVNAAGSGTCRHCGDDLPWAGGYTPLVALVLATQPPEQMAASVLGMPEELAAGIVTLLALPWERQRQVLPPAFDALRDVLRTEEIGALGGPQYVGRLIEAMPPARGRALLQALRRRLPETAAQVRQWILWFEDLARVPSRGWQNILHHIRDKTLAIALMGADDGVLQQVHSAMTNRMAARIRDEQHALGPQMSADIQAAQAEVLAVARRLYEEGKIIVEAPGWSAAMA